MDAFDKEKTIKNEIIKVAQELFQKYGYEKTTMEDIAKAARKSKSTLYQCFRNKDEVLEGVISAEMREVYSCIIREIAKVQTATEQIRAYMNTVISETKKKFFLYALLQGEFKAILCNCANIKKDIDLLEIDEVKNILRKGILLGEFSSKYMSSVSNIAYYLVNGARGLLLQLVLAGENDSEYFEEKNMEAMLGLLISGLTH